MICSTSHLSQDSSFRSCQIEIGLLQLPSQLAVRLAVRKHASELHLRRSEFGHNIVLCVLGMPKHPVLRCVFRLTLLDCLHLNFVCSLMSFRRQLKNSVRAICAVLQISPPIIVTRRIAVVRDDLLRAPPPNIMFPGELLLTCNVSSGERPFLSVA